MMRIRSLVAALFAGALAAQAAGQVLISSGFDTPSDWSVLLLNNPGQTATVSSSGGNPGGYADLRPMLVNNKLGGAGFSRALTFFTIGAGGPGGTPLTEIVMSADYRWFSGPGLTLVPFLTQGNLMYRPSTSFALGTDTAWTSLGTMTFPISTFTNSTGVPLNSQALTQVGFMAIIRSDTPETVIAHLGIDNLNLQVIPAPGAATAGLALLAAAAARRRR